jgi:mono/diheme cytochrome c family protein
VKRLLLLLLALTLVVALPACGGEEDETAQPETVEGTPPETSEGGGEGDPENGKTVFASAGCGGCHTLSDAGSNGSVGPNLDDAQPDEAAVAEKVTNGGGGMPAFSDRLSEQEIADVAAYVSSVAGS